MVTENVERLKRIVDDVMEVAPGQVQEVGAIDATAQVGVVCAEWAQAAGSSSATQACCGSICPASRSACCSTPSICAASSSTCSTTRAATRAASRARSGPARCFGRRRGRVVFSVLSDGAPIPADVEPYLFEPFFSTRSRGAGLGLYICRELCERYGASIDYRLRRPRSRGATSSSSTCGAPSSARRTDRTLTG